jgi:hypothetical protein
MSQRFGWTALLGLCILAGCGGGSSSPAASSSGASSSSGAIVSNVVTLTVGPGPTAAGSGTFNIPYVSVKVCNPGTTTCATINNVLVDTGSIGLRVMASALQSAGVTLANTADPSSPGHSIAECLPFADGYTWGPVATADVSLGGELASSLSVNIINDNGSYPATVPASCTSMSTNTSLNSVTAFDANGVLGVGVFDQDCGSSCADCASLTNGCNTPMSDLYYSCNTGANTCAFTPVAMTAQVRNPVALFATDNNGVIVELPTLPLAGQATASGSLIFGIATQSNNGLGAAFVLTADSSGNFTTTYKGQALSGSFIDSGSNGYYFPDSAITVCTNTMADPHASDFYCPNSTLTLSATNQGQNGLTSLVPFEITSLNSLNGVYASATIGGPATANAALGPYFDWGLPFFYGKHVFTAIEGKPAGSAVGPYYAY